MPDGDPVSSGLSSEDDGASAVGASVGVGAEVVGVSVGWGPEPSDSCHRPRVIVDGERA